MAHVSIYFLNKDNYRGSGNQHLITFFSHWLFGEKEHFTKLTDGKDTRVRGWFPRPCAIPVSEKDKEFENYFETDPDAQYLIQNTSVSSKSTETEKNYNHRIETVSSPVNNKKKHK